MRPVAEQDFFAVSDIPADSHTSAIGRDLRRFQRVRVKLFGRYMLDDGREHACQIINMSPGGMAISGLVSGRLGRRVVVYADHLGRIEGIAVRRLHNGLAAKILASGRKQDRLAAQLTWLANRHLLDQQQTQWTAPRDFPTVLTLPNGLSIPCTVIEMSASGAVITCRKKLPVGLLATIGNIQCRVVRHIDGRVIVEFTRVRHPRQLAQDIAGATT
jgi:hypothetical protein